MRHGKDYMSDKPAITMLAQLADARAAQAETKRIFSVLIERHESQVINKAGELVQGRRDRSGAPDDRDGAASDVAGEPATVVFQARAGPGASSATLPLTTSTRTSF